MIAPGCRPVVLGEILRRCLVQLEIGLRDYTSRHYQQIMRCIYELKNLKCRLPAAVECIVDQDTVILRKTLVAEEQISDQPVPLKLGDIYRLGPFRIAYTLLHPDQVSVRRFMHGKTCWIEWLDADRIQGSLQIRIRKPGDRFRPLGMDAQKKVGKFLTSVKISKELKRQVLIVEDAEKIVWVAPVRISEDAKVTARTRRIVQLSIKK